ncbi:alanyl-tRNA synthetase [Clostridium tetanomorphum]|uniref:Alanine--tRNA ligase n=1 Tax=Clostridium tetanomorphum TaxID=1553 RepID=A0A923ECA7_CLOTT|nr:DHHA1 domain-containing protein [Clostridium tetanomorphum]KAJ53613.1 threonyl/alanyl tRNA synthetase SAD [Clostridium tetanomorphum DSM 665]MBC2397820.1 alanyl-tRNA editing protein AlaX-L [Clostridium tetanomorphum]MBP1864577.1 alanyl-tRNA synthetase [Clostridium tetanomorphum]NRS84046.1 alanyl-tRNA synthetase [Clostridium tetanomorphum]NRZ97261.1 alanyl-tRNA synthetase [Clostridium tetanomorphum]
MLEKLYYENPYEKEFIAEIINIIEKHNEYHIELDKTYFYPGDENHPNDTGCINSVDVINVYEKDEKTYHVVKVKPLKIHKVKCIIDWEKRYAYMQQNLAQHIISASFSELFNANAINTHFDNDDFYIDIDKTIGKDEIKKVEEMTNKIILNNIAVDIFYATNAELKKLSIKKTTGKKDKKIKIIKIGHIHISNCTGIYPKSTIEIQLIKISKYEKLKNGTRIYILCGSKAVSDFFSKSEKITAVCNLLKCNEDDLLSKVETFSENFNKVTTEKNALKAQVAEYEVQNMLNSCENINDIRILKSIYTNVDLKYVNMLATKLVSNSKIIVLFGVVSENKVQLIFMRSKDLSIISMNSLLKDAITLIDGSGGGSDFSAQGGGKNNNNLDSSIEYAYNKVKTSILSDCI